jgi:hypothetical protein
MEELITKEVVISKHLVKTAVEEEKQTIVHCKVSSAGGMRIWKTTYLVQNTGRKSQLILAHGISVAPSWCRGNIINGLGQFTLIFEGLDKECKSFYLDEIIPERNGYFSEVVKRNSVDVYNVDLLIKK